MASTLHAMRRGALRYGTLPVARAAVGGVLAGALAMALAAPVTAQPCRAQWEGGFTRQEPDGAITALVPLRSGEAGASLVALGSFTQIARLPTPNTPAMRAAQWNGRDWAPMGTGLSSTPTAAVIWDDGQGGGPALYVGGAFAAPNFVQHGLARWTGSEWQLVGGAMNGAGVMTLAVWDDGTGEALYVGGSFTVSGTTLRNIVRWDGQSWSAPWSPALYSGIVTTLVAAPPGPLEGLYAGGDLYNFNGAPLGRLARWDGQQWASLAGASFSSRPTSLAYFDAALGPSLMVGGTFTSAGPVYVDGLARWDGSNWHDVDRTLPRRPFVSFDDGEGEAIWFFPSSTPPTKWDGQVAEQVGNRGMNPRALARFDAGDGRGERLFGGLNGGATLDSRPYRFGVLESDSWERLDNGPWFDFAFLGSVDLGDGEPSLIGATPAREPTAANIVQLKEGRWRDVVTLPQTRRGVYSVARFDRGLAPGVAGVYFGLGPILYANDGVGAYNGIARWDGAQWSSVGAGLVASGNQTATASAMLVHDDGAGGGPQLYVGGNFETVDGQPSQGLARWDGVAWTNMSNWQYGEVRGLTIFDDGSGPALFACGYFKPLNGGFSNYQVAKWDGQAWTLLYIPPSFLGTWGQSIHVFDTSAGPRLVVSTVNGSSGQFMWDGSEWSPIGDRYETRINRYVSAFFTLPSASAAESPFLIAFASGLGVCLGSPYTGEYRTLGVWNGARWSLPDTDAGGDIGSVTAATLFDDGSGPALWVAGKFTTLGSERTFNVGRLRTCDTTCEGDATFDGVVDMRDLNVVLGDYGQSAPSAPGREPFLPGDLNLDGTVDFLDLNILLGRFGLGC